MSEGQTVDNLDKLKLKEIRKQRKLQKKIIKRQEKEQENEKKQLQVKLGPKDQHVTIISKNVAENIKSHVNTTSNNNYNLNIDDNFPNLNDTAKSKPKQTNPSNSFATRKQIASVPTKSKTTTLTINLTEILMKTRPVTTQKSPRETEEKYEGNCLDSSKPKRYKGKQREIPKRKPPSKLKSQIISDINDCDTSKTYNVCNNEITDELNLKVKEFLSSIVRFQENLFKRDPIKGNAKRRYVTGFREVKKYLKVKKIKFIILSPNNKNLTENGALDILIHDLISLATENNVPYLFALSRKELGQITLKNIPISCIGIFYYDGAEQLFNDLLILLKSLRKPEEETEDKDGEISNKLLEVLSI